MAKIIVVRDAEKGWEDVSSEWKNKAKPGEPGLRFKRLLPHAENMPNMQRTCYEPLHVEPPHSHSEDEVLYLLSGSMAFGREMLGRGDALYVPRDMVYSLRAGADGAEFLRIGLPA